MEAGGFRAMDAEEATDGGPFGVGEDGVRGLSCPRRPEEGFTTVTFAPLEETRGQEEASKLHRSRRTGRREAVHTLKGLWGSIEQLVR